MLDIMTACTAKCRYCLHQFNNLTKPQAMSMKDFEAIKSTFTREHWDYVYMYLSGEPLLHPQYWSMLAEMSRAGITTNTASKLCFEISDAHMDYALCQLKAPAHFDITIDAHNQDTQNHISTGIDTEEVYENLKQLASWLGSKVAVTVTTVVNRFNAPHLKEIQARVKSCGVASWTSKPMGYYMGYMMTPEDEAMIVDLAPNRSARFDVIDGHVRPRMKSCSRFIKPVIGVDGKVTVCCHDMLFRQAHWDLLQTNSLDAIVQSKAYRKAIALGKKMKLDICKGCN